MGYETTWPLNPMSYGPDNGMYKKHLDVLGGSHIRAALGGKEWPNLQSRASAAP